MDSDTLTIAEVTEGDEGVYTCIMNTTLDHDSASAELSVVGTYPDPRPPLARPGGSVYLFLLQQIHEYFIPSRQLTFSASGEPLSVFVPVSLTSRMCLRASSRLIASRLGQGFGDSERIRGGRLLSPWMNISLLSS